MGLWFLVETDGVYAKTFAGGGWAVVEEMA